MIQKLRVKFITASMLSLALVLLVKTKLTIPKVILVSAVLGLLLG